MAEKRKESYKRVQKEKMRLKSSIKKAKERIIAKLKANQKEIFENRHKFEKLTSEDIKKLRDERKRLEKELDEIIGLKSTTKEELKGMSEEDRKKVEQAKKKYKDNTDRIDEIDDKLNMVKLFEGRTPIEMFKRNKLIIEKVEESFNFDKIDTILSKEMKTMREQNDKKKETKNEKKPKQESQTKVEPKPKSETKPQTQQTPKSENLQQTPAQAPIVKTQPQQTQQPNGIESNVFADYFANEGITIYEKEGLVGYSFGNQQGIISLKDIKEDKKAMFKRYGIRKMIGFRAARRVNPAIIKAFEQIENGDRMIGEYLKSIKGKSQFNFYLNHDLVGLNIFQRISRNRQIKREQKCGAIISKEESYEYNNSMSENAQLGNTNIESQPRKSKQRQMDSYVKADRETLRRIEQVEKEATESIVSDVKEIVNEGQTQGEEATI